VMTDKILDYLDRHSIGDDDLLFPLSRLAQEALQDPNPVEPKAIPVDLDRTEPDARGRTYQHGTMVAYGPGKCRCEWCRLAVTTYRQRRRQRGLDKKPQRETKRGQNLTDHLPRD